MQLQDVVSTIKVKIEPHVYDTGADTAFGVTLFAMWIWDDVEQRYHFITDLTREQAMFFLPTGFYEPLKSGKVVTFSYTPSVVVHHPIVD